MVVGTVVLIGLRRRPLRIFGAARGAGVVVDGSKRVFGRNYITNNIQ